MSWREATADRAAFATNAVAAAVTLALLVALTLDPPGPPPPPLAEAPKPTDTQLSLVEEAPPPPAQAAPSPPEARPEPLPAPPPQTAPSPLPPPRPPRPRHTLHRPNPVPQTQTQEDVAPNNSAPSETYGRVAQQAAENHSAEGAYVGRLHALVARATVPPHSAAYRLHHPTGEVLVGFTLARNGALSNVHVIRSSGSDILDAQGCVIVAGLHYPAMPEDVYAGAPSHAFSVPVAFSEAGADDEL
jgi:TonB family protein